jgi:hypothetical protein
MQNTRLNTFVDQSLGRFGRWLRNPWRRLSLVIISLLLGNFLATVFSTVAGQTADIDVIMAALLLLFTEVVSWLVYRGDRGRIQPGVRDEARPLLIELLNGTKLGLIYGLFVEAFKLGS